MTTRFAPAQVRSAIEIVTIDYDCTRSERLAFAKFINSLSNLSVSPITADSNIPCRAPARATLDQASSSRSNSQITHVYELYRETIMDVDHYSQEYDDTLAESIAEELGSETAAALRNSDHLTPQLRDRLIETSNRARESRHALLQGLKHEHSALHNADEALSELGTGLDDVLAMQSLQTWSDEELATTQKNLQDREQECERLAADRQTTLHEQRVPSTHHIELEFVEYLYQSLSVDYPMLTDISNLAGTFRTARSTVEDTLASRENSHCSPNSTG